MASLMFDTDGHLMDVLDVWPRDGSGDDYDEEYDEAKARYEEAVSGERDRLYDQPSREDSILRWVCLALFIAGMLALFNAI